MHMYAALLSLAALPGGLAGPAEMWLQNVTQFDALAVCNDGALKASRSTAARFAGSLLARLRAV